MVNLSRFSTETITSVHWWTDSLLSIKTTRPESLKFESGQFVTLGLKISDEKYAYRAFSMVSAIYDQHLEFYCKIVPDGLASGALLKIKPGDQLVISKTAIGTLLVRDLHDGVNLWLLATGTGLAPFLSILQDEYVYHRFTAIHLLHSVRYREDLSYKELITTTLLKHPLIGRQAAEQLHYYPFATRDPEYPSDRLTALFEPGLLLGDINVANDRFMLCGSHPFNEDISSILVGKGFKRSKHLGDPGDFLVEKAFMEK